MVIYTRLDGVWAVRVDDEAILPQPKPTGFHTDFLAWLDDTRYLIADANPDCIYRNLRAIDVGTLEIAPVFEGGFWAPARFAPTSGAILLSLVSGPQGEGTFLLSPPEATHHRVLDWQCVQTRWLPESDVFEAYLEALVSANGRRIYRPPAFDQSYKPAVSRQGHAAWQVIENQKASTVVQPNGGELQAILEMAIDVLIWDAVEGNTLLIAGLDGVLYTASFPDLIPRARSDRSAIAPPGRSGRPSHACPSPRERRPRRPRLAGTVESHGAILCQVNPILLQQRLPVAI